MILLLLGLACLFGARNIATFLAESEPVGGDYLVIEGWMGKDELDEARGYFESHGYRRAIVVGGPISNDFYGDSNYAERAAAYLVARGFPRQELTVIESPYSAQDRTFLNAVLVRDWFVRGQIDLQRLDIFTSNVHARRSRYLYDLAFPSPVEVGVIASRPREFELEHWWRSSGTAKYVAVEFVGWLMVRCCFSPGAPGSHAEKWGIDKGS
jgi:hypothetical protein